MKPEALFADLRPYSHTNTYSGWSEVEEIPRYGQLRGDGEARSRLCCNGEILSSGVASIITKISVYIFDYIWELLLLGG